MLLADLSVPFEVDSTEGDRVGYWCPECETAYPCSERVLDWEYKTLGCDATCPCGGQVESIWTHKWWLADLEGNR